MHPHLTQVLTRLDTTRADLRAAVDAVPAERRRERPAPERWSTCEVLEHLSMTEGVFTQWIADAIAAAQSGIGPEASARLPLPDDIESRMRDRTNRRTAPETAQPRGSLDHDAAWRAVERGHERLRDVVAAMDGLALSEVAHEHRTFGRLNVYQWVELIAAHEARHAAQIREIAGQFVTPT